MQTKTILGKVLNTLLSTKRPHGSKTNIKSTEWVRSMLPYELQQASSYDGAGNLHIDNRTQDSHKTLFVAHIDTVHRNEGKNKIRKTKTHWYAKGDVLGADDGAGVAMLMHMIHHNIGGYYIITQGEERGGVGARYLVEKSQSLLQEFDRAIAFDRRGIDSVITHQGWGRCCSDAFGIALCDALMLGDDDLMYLNDDTGVYTDTAEFTDIIPECTNISVGYAREHTQEESLDIVFFAKLSEAVLRVEWDALPVDRDPAVQEYVGGSATDWWTNYKIPTVGHTKASAGNDMMIAYDYDYDTAEYTRAEALDAVVDAQYGYYDDLVRLVALSVYPDDPALAEKHMSFKGVDPAMLDEAFEALEAGEDIDIVLGWLFEEAHTA